MPRDRRPHSRPRTVPAAGILAAAVPGAKVPGAKMAGVDPPGDRPIATQSHLVLMGEFGRPHGLDGSIRLKSYTDDPTAIAGYGPLIAQDGRRFVLTHARQAAGDQRDLLVVRVEGVGSREAAEPLNRLGLHVERDRLGKLEEDEFFLTDLVGLTAYAPDGREIGRVFAVPDYGSGALLEIAPVGGGRTILLPFTKAFVPTIDIVGGRVVVDIPEEVEDDSETPPVDP